MSEQLPETWSTRELPILKAALAQLDRGAPVVDLELLRIELGLTAPEIRVAVDALSNASPPYINWSIGNGWDGERSPGTIDRVYERARRELGTWPTADNLVAEIAAALAAAAEQTTEPERRGRLQAAAEALSGFARDVAVEVIAKHVGG